jgi:glycosyltransferase involved in cell wall biosynthesis
VKVLYVATRSPWPPVDGGRVLMAHTIDGLLARGHRVTVVAPALGTAPRVPTHDRLEVRLVEGRRQRALVTAARVCLAPHRALVERYAHPGVAREVRDCVRAGVDVLHVEQLQALAAAEPVRGGVPVVLRAENVESALWAQGARSRWWRRPAVPIAWGLARVEGLWLEEAGVVASVSDRDTVALRRLAPLASVETVRIPMPAHLPSGSTPLAGAPAVVLFAGRWWPNRHGARWFLRDVWPRVATMLPEARLHVFGDAGIAGDRVTGHQSPADAADAFAPGAILAAPVRVGSGASVKVLEAWARGVPVVATPIVAEGVDPGGAALMIARTADDFATALRCLTEPQAHARAIAAGRATLAAQHDPAACTAALEAVYAAAIAAWARPA